MLRAQLTNILSFITDDDDDEIDIVWHLREILWLFSMLRLKYLILK